MMQIFSILIAVSILTFSCKSGDSSKTKSFVGLNADIDPNILKGEAPSFLYLQQWFQKELPVRASASQAGKISYQVHPPISDSTGDKLPVEYRTKLIEYLKHQQSRVAAFQGNLKNPAKLEELFKLEATEMADILMALIEPSYTPKTQDLLARLISIKPIRSFIDRYSVEILEKLYARSQRSLLAGMNTERDNFVKILKKTYISDSGATAGLVTSLQQNCAKLGKMLSALKSFGNSPCESGQSANLSDDSSFSSAADDLNGAPGQALGILGSLSSPNGYSAAAGVSPQLTIFNGRDPNAMDPLSGTNPSSTAYQSGNQAGGGTAYPSNNGGSGGSYYPGNNGSNDGSYNYNTTPNASNNNFAGQMIRALEQVFSDSDMMLANSREAHNTVVELPPKPRGRCGNKSGLDLVICQRYIETMRPISELRGGRPKSVQLQLDGFGPSGGNRLGYNFYMISKYATKVQNQGSEGACTAFGLAHTLGILGRMKGKSGEYDAWRIWSAQGQSPMTDAAIGAAKGMNFDGLRISRARSYDPSPQALKQQLDSGRPIYYASSTDGSWDGASRGNAEITCQGDGGGHAYAIVGYDDASQKFIIKNSWGDFWGDRGYGYVSYNCIGRMDDEAYDIELQ